MKTFIVSVIVTASYPPPPEILSLPLFWISSQKIQKLPAPLEPLFQLAPLKTLNLQPLRENKRHLIFIVSIPC